MTHDSRTQNPADARRGVQDERTVTFLRLGVGLIGILLPVALPFGNWLAALVTGRSTDGYWPGSMSASYYTDTRNVFVGALCALGVFLICYRFDRRDDRWSTAAGFFAVGVALCPTSPSDASDIERTVGVFHLVFASLLFVMLAMFCLYSFRNPRSTQPAAVGAAYLTAGVVILVALLLSVVAGATGIGKGWEIRPLYLCEWLATWAFGVAWLGAALELARHGRRESDPAAVPRQPGARAVEASQPEAQA
ncbi:hypothetical protein BX285_7322 [Streptomyces sp. 1114.5]|uniref:hypothetical protein n=1 Tax=unclassified Streptomyces TaxID=2593676 RepID=UPI000BDAF1E3|nr:MULTISPECIES: hypothetical protein [unclassified Streptomyces]RKT08950.1 hypothetical protein BX285_7322 [Streptomyces sp. 1114.5]SOB79378.1 hypothetical protein SAMN06272789_0400 [Streptomyces sp. 1331.2]